MQISSSWQQRLEAGAERIRTIRQNKSTARVILVVASIAFVAGLFVSIRHLPRDATLSAPRFLLFIVVFGVPLRLALNALETKLSARLAGAGFGWAQSFRIGLTSSLANMLPLPGGPIVRLAALKRAGVTYSKGGASTGMLALIWAGLAFLVAGLFLVESYMVVALTFVIGALASIIVAIAGLWLLCRSWRMVASAIALKCAALFVMLLRFSWAFAALGIDIPPADVTVFAVSGVAGSIVSIVPAGLGVTEGVAAALAPLTGVAPAAAYVAVTLNRTVSIPALLAAAFLVALLRPAAEPERPAA